MALQFDVPLGTASRPAWRGLLHVYVLWVAIPAMAGLVVAADTGRARLGVTVYAIGVCAMFATSATYHRWVHSLRARELWRRADHAVIFAMIAGTFTPMCLLAVPDSWGVPMLVAMWALGAAGMAIKLCGWRHARITGGVMYIGLGWVGVFVLPATWQQAGAAPVCFLVLGGLIYTVGAIWLWRRWPCLVPSVFGYHEVWHVCTVAAAASHAVAVWLVIV